MLFSNFLRELEWKPIGVIQLKSLRTADLFRLGRQHIRQQFLSPFQGLQEPGFLTLQLRQDHLLALHQLRMHRLHQRNGRLTHGLEKRLIDAQETSMPHHPTQQATQDVATAQIAGRDAIADQLRHGSTVIADHLE